MAPPVVVVTFYSRGGETERLATAAAVGAVQARAGIRMRRLSDPDPAATLARYPEWREPLERMYEEYVPPKESDVLAADALVVGLPGDLSLASVECAGFFDLLARLHAEGKLLGRAAAVVGSGPASEAVTGALARAGLTVIPPAAPAGSDVEQAIALGRRLVEVAQSLRRRT